MTLGKSNPTVNRTLQDLEQKQQAKPLPLPLNLSITKNQNPFQKSRSVTLGKLNLILPQFNTNHKEKDGTTNPVSLANETPAKDMLEDLLNNLSPTKSTFGGFHEEKIGDYMIEKTIGEGSFGKVKLAKHILTNQYVAIKCLEKNNIETNLGTSERVLREIFLLSHLNHPNINKLLEVIDQKSKINLVMEYESGGELFDFLIKHKKLDENISRKFFRQLLSAVQYCHAHGVVHRDLKPENILLDSKGNIKIIDFGFANLMREDNLLQTFCGSAAYAAPEMLSGKKYSGKKADAWSFGIILFVLVTGTLPFDDKNMSKMYLAIMTGKFKLPDNISTECKELISKILKVKPEERLSLQEISEHEWTNDKGRYPPIHMCNVQVPTTPHPDSQEHFIEPCICCNDEIDEKTEREIHEKLLDYGFSLNQIKESIQSDYPSPILASYHIIKRYYNLEDRKMEKIGLVLENFEEYFDEELIKKKKLLCEKERKDIEEIKVKEEKEKSVNQRKAINEVDEEDHEFPFKQKNDYAKFIPRNSANKPITNGTTSKIYSDVKPENKNYILTSESSKTENNSEKKMSNIKSNLKNMYLEKLENNKNAKCDDIKIEFKKLSNLKFIELFMIIHQNLQNFGFEITNKSGELEESDLDKVFECKGIFKDYEEETKNTKKFIPKSVLKKLNSTEVVNLMLLNSLCEEITFRFEFKKLEKTEILIIFTLKMGLTALEIFETLCEKFCLNIV
ncbi:MAP microtubule affinity-regulating kinase 1 [Clydaea vesicula]|uniref:non-specific serine/threonine protein kinase n=1 Tax=Clydaea vesicula TaxID=447962 RepID=A0AAD5U7D0_9FUNG|nr:MAP microtubule affinity-regulating kinase 1 [Clydaea vesicula]